MFVGLGAVACGSSGGGGMTGPGPVTGGGPGPSGATITISAGGVVSPKTVTVTVGQSVTFVSNDSRPHDMESDPHPAHTDCPPIEGIGLISLGQTRLTNAFTVARTCGFHDHGDDTNANLKGTIVIQLAIAVDS